MQPSLTSHEESGDEKKRHLRIKEFDEEDGNIEELLVENVYSR